MKLTAADKILIIAPHPDDEIISCFKIIKMAVKKAAAVKVVFLTNGERNHLNHALVKKKIFISKKDMESYGKERKNEALAVLGEMGEIRSEFMGLPDSKVIDFIQNKKFVKTLFESFSDFNPTLVISPSLTDFHTDHSAAAILSEMVVSSGLYKGPVLYYLIHYREASEPNLKIPLNEEELKYKKNLLSMYKSQKYTLKKVNKILSHEERFYRKDNFLSACLAPVFTGLEKAWFETAELSRGLNHSVITLVYSAGEEAEVLNCQLDCKIPLSSMDMKDDKKKFFGFQKFFREKGGFVSVPLFSGKKKLLGIKIGKKYEFFDRSGFVKPCCEQARKKTRVCLVIPCYNIVRMCIESVKRSIEYSDKVFVVDDGSTDETFEELKKLKNSGQGDMEIIRFKKNRGKGFALVEGIKRAVSENFDFIITMDGDLQHLPEDIPRFVKAYLDGGEFIIGFRKFDGKIPARSRFGNKLINGFIRTFFNANIIDSQSGFRGFSRELALKMLSSGRVKPGRYETEMDIIAEVLRFNSRIIQLEIKTIYHQNNKSSSFRVLSDSAKIAKTLMYNLVKRNSLIKKELFLLLLFYSARPLNALNIKDLSRFAIENSRTILSLQKKLESSKAFARSSESSLYPVFSASGEADYNAYQKGSGLNDGMMGQAGAELSLDLSKTFSGTALSSIEIRRALLSLETAKSETVKAVKQDYYRLYILLGKEADYAEASSYFYSHIEDIEKMEANGLDLKLDRVRAEIQLNLIKSQLSQTRAEIKNVLRNLSSSAGRELKAEDLFPGDVSPSPAVFPRYGEGLLKSSETVSSSIEISSLYQYRLGEMDALSAFETYRQSQFSFLPSINLGISKSISPIDPAMENYKTYLAINFYVFGFGEKKHQRNALFLDYQAGLAAQEENKRSLLLSVENLRGEINSYLANYLELEKSYEFSLSNLETAKIYYKQGKIKETDLLSIFSENLDVKEQARDILGFYFEKKTELECLLSGTVPVSVY